MRIAALGLAAGLAAVTAAGAASRDVALRVGTSGDYAPFSWMTSEAPGPGGDRAGFDVAVARAFAADLEREVRFVPFRWPELLGQLTLDRFDLAMSGVTVRPERSAAGRFSVPVVETGAVLLAPAGRGWRNAAEADRRGVRIAVNAGGHLERVAHAHFPSATRIAVPENAAVLEALLEGRVDAAVTDSLEVREWLRAAEGRGLRALGPFTLDRKAYLVRAELPELAAALDAWLLERESDGTLARLREQHLGGDAAPTARPLDALLSAVDERLSLMPLVAAAKRRRGLPLADPAQEERVLDATATLVRSEAARLAVAPPAEAAVLRLFRAQIEAAKQVQRHTRPDGRGPDPGGPELESVLRPAIARIGERIGRLLFALPPRLADADARAAARHQLRAPGLSDRARWEIADAIAALWRTSAPGDRPGQQARQDGQRETDPVAQEREAPAQDRHLPRDEAVQGQ